MLTFSAFPFSLSTTLKLALFIFLRFSVSPSLRLSPAPLFFPYKDRSDGVGRPEHHSLGLADGYDKPEASGPSEQCVQPQLPVVGGHSGGERGGAVGEREF